MVEIEIPLGASVDDSVIDAVERAAGFLGLTIASRGRLARYRDSTHWHLRTAGKAGTLEVTWWPPGRRLWVAYHGNRVGDGWVVLLAPELATAISQRIAAPDGANGDYLPP